MRKLPNCNRPYDLDEFFCKLQCGHILQFERDYHPCMCMGLTHCIVRVLLLTRKSKDFFLKIQLMIVILR